MSASANRKYRILYVDDLPDSGRQHLENRGFALSNKLPSDIATLEQITNEIKNVDAILMDYDLHDDSGGDGLSAAGEVIDGLELLERIRAAVRRRPIGTSMAPFERPLIAIYSNKVDEFKETIGAYSIPAAARLHDVDWIWEKTDTSAASDLTTILEARRRAFDTKWRDSEKEVREQLRSLMCLGDTAWSETALEHLEAMKLPIQGLVRTNDAGSLLRHLLHVVFPYPGALIDLVCVAQRLRMPVAVLRQLVDDGQSKLVQQLRERTYCGVLSSFGDVRYWRAGVDDLVWRLTEGRTASGKEGSQKLFEAAGRDWKPYPGPVVPVVDAEFAVTEELVDVTDAVQIQPDEWPPQVDSPWTAIERLQSDSDLRAMVVTRDLDRLTEALNDA